MDVKLNITKVSKFTPDFSDIRDFTPEESEAHKMSGRNFVASYHGYRGVAYYDEDTGRYHGVVAGIVSQEITFGGATPEEVVEDFQNAVFYYVEDCYEFGYIQEDGW